MSKTALICAQREALVARLEASLSSAGYAVETVATQDEAISALKASRRDALVSEAPRHAFARLVQSAFRLDPAMPVQLIDGRAVFCLYPLAGQPEELVAAVRAAGVRISDRLLQRPGHPSPLSQAVLI